MRQPLNVWMISLYSGDKYVFPIWQNYYNNEDDDDDPSPLGQMVNGSIIGVLLDMDRGYLTFFKDGNEMGVAFSSTELRCGDFYPMVLSMDECQVHIFHPTSHPFYIPPKGEETLLEEQRQKEEAQKEKIEKKKQEERVKQGRNPNDETVCSFLEKLGKELD